MRQRVRVICEFLGVEVSCQDRLCAYPARDGSLLMVGFQSPEQARGVYSVSKSGEIKTLAKEIGRVDGIYQLRDVSLLVTDWNSGTLSKWSPKTGMQTLASGFKGCEAGW